MHEIDDYNAEYFENLEEIQDILREICKDNDIQESKDRMLC